MATARSGFDSHEQLAAEHDEPGSQGPPHGQGNHRGAALQGAIPDGAHHEVAQGVRYAGGYQKQIYLSVIGAQFKTKYLYKKIFVSL